MIGRAAIAALRISGREFGRHDLQAPAAPARVGEEGERDIGPARPDVEDSDRPVVEVGRRHREESIDRVAAQPDPAEDAIESAEVPEVALERGGIVESPVEELIRVRQPVHPGRLHGVGSSGTSPPTGSATLGRGMAHRSARRRFTPAAIGLVLLAVGATAAAPVLAGIATFDRVQSLGDRGTDVATIQQLFRHHQDGPGPTPASGRTVTVRAIDPLVLPIDGIYGARTELAVRAFQASRGLPETGTVDAETWGRLIVPLSQGAEGHAVVALQRLLREKVGPTVPTDGVFGPATTSAVKAFQAHMGLPQTGVADAATWRALVWHFELPRFAPSSLCDNSTGNGPANWGTAEMTSTLEAAGAAMVAAGYGRVVVNDVSFEHGGDIAGHETHEVGLDADLRPMRKANDQCSFGTRWNLPSYDRAATRELVKAIHAATPGHVKLIFFSDPVLIGEGLTTYHSAHDDHLHVRLCEAWFPDRRYRC